MNTGISILPNYSYADYISWKVKNWELIDGIPFALTPPDIKLHAEIKYRLAAKFENQLRVGSFAVLLNEVLLAGDNNVLRPDLSISEKNADTITKPWLVGEIIEKENEVIEKLVKFRLYEVLCIRYYIIIDPDKNEAEVYELVNNKYQLMKQGKDISFPFELDDCSVEIAFSEIW
ncbi:MAG TPA: Uma2 family endonuclease [Chitinophagaceae bacterium]|nr:Uma2 family endonuclease [Chitinophagaceae bacterium]